MTNDEMPDEIWAGGSKASNAAGQWTAHEDCAKYYNGIKYVRADKAQPLPEEREWTIFLERGSKDYRLFIDEVEGGNQFVTLSFTTAQFERIFGNVLQSKP